jgi:hypothetical protein
MAWQMDIAEYLELKIVKGYKDSDIAKANFITTRTLDRWKRKEGIKHRLNKYTTNIKRAN